MNRQFATIVVCGGISLLVSACATKGFVREQISTTETRLVQRADTTEGKLRETSDRTASNTQALEAAGQRLTSLDGRIGEVQTLAGDAKKDAATVAAAQRDAEAQFTQRFKERNKYSMVDTKVIFFDFNKADQRGTDKYNYQLTRDRVDAVVRYLVQRHNIDLRRIHAVGMGKATPAQGEKGNKETFAKSRRVEIRLLAPQS